jgi:hypothetical protein
MFEFHQAVGDILLSIGQSGVQVLLDSACGGTRGAIEFYWDGPPCPSTRLVQPDAILIRGGEIRVVVEIEYSDLRPLYLCGKILATAISRYARYDKRLFPISDSLLFLQVFIKLTEDEEWSKFQQFRYLEAAITQGLQKCRDGQLKYSLHYGTTDEFLLGHNHQDVLRGGILGHLL